MQHNNDDDDDDNSKQQPLVQYGTIQSEEAVEEDDGELILYKYRFVVMSVYFLQLCLTGAIQNTWAPLQDRVILVFDTTTTTVNWLALLYPSLNIILSWFVGFVLERRGVRFTLFGVATTTVGGAWLRYLGVSSTRMWLTMIGQGCVALGQPFALGASTQLSEAWFSEDGRAIATAVGGLAPIIGTVVASIVGPMFFEGVSCSDLEHNHRKLTMFVFYTAVLCSVNWVLMLFMRNAPPTPPSHSAVQQGKRHLRHEDDLPLSVMILTALRNWNFVLLLCGFGFGYASINGLTTLVNQILHPLHYTDTQVGNIGAALGFGIIGSVVVGVLTDITKKFTLIVRVCATLAAIGFAWFLYILWSDPHRPHPTLVFISVGVLGFFAVPLVPVILEMGVEVTYPLSEGVSTSLLWMSGNLIGMITVLVSNAMQASCMDRTGPPSPTSCTKSCERPETSMRTATIFMGSLFGCALLSTIFFRGRFLRLESEKQYHDDHDKRVHPELYNDV